MVDLEKFVGDTRVAEAVYKVWETRQKAEKPRGHLGASEIGEECERKLWLGFRRVFVKNFPGRILRLFNRGKREEQVVYDELAEAGIFVSGTQDHGLAQFGHFGGSCDGIAVGVPGAETTEHVLEIKTHSAKSFAALQKNGVAKAQPKHWAQMQTYMRFFKKTRSLYFAVCKDSDEIHTERVREDKHAQDMILKKAERIVFAVEPPPRIASSPSDFRCKLCDASDVCWRYAPPTRDCRNCCHATPLDRSTLPRPDDSIQDVEPCPWKCDIGRHYGVVCGEHLFIPPVVSDDYELKEDGCVWHKLDGKRICDCPRGRFPSVDEGQAPEIMPREQEEF